MSYDFTRTGAQIEEIHNTVDDPKSNAQFSDDIRTIAGEYRGLWPDTGGSANKGDTYQTQVGGTPTGQYFAALQNTTVDPAGDDVNWREVVSDQSLGGLTNYQADSISDMVGGIVVGGAIVSHKAGTVWAVSDDNGTVSHFKTVDSVADIQLTSSLWAKSLIKKDLYDLTVIRNDVSKFSAAMTQRSQNAKVVVTGGSVSWNGFGYPSSWNVNGAGYATDAPFGLSSWPNLIRDSWFASHPSFTPIENLNIETDATVGEATSPEDFGMNAKALKVTFSDSSKSLTIKNKSYDTQFLIVSYSSQAFGASPAVIDVNGTEYNTSSPDDLYRGRGYFLIPLLSSQENIIDNVLSLSGGSVTPGGVLYIYGITGDGSPNFKITGKGGYSSGQILSEYGTLVAPYTPNFVIYMVGGNDSGLDVPISDFKQNLRDFVALVRADEPDAVIVMAGPTPNTGIQRSKSLEYNRAMRQVVDELEISMVDMYSRLEHIDFSYWMFDNTHFNKNGDTLIFNIMKLLLFPSVDTPSYKFIPARENYVGLNLSYYENNPARLLSSSAPLASISTTASEPTTTMLKGSGITAAYSGSGASSTVVVTFPTGTAFSGYIPFFTTGDASDSIKVKQSISGTEVEFFAVDSSGSQVDIVGSGLFFRVTSIA